MKFLTFLASILLSVSAVTPSFAQDPVDPVLERYTLGVGQNSDGVVATEFDKYFGGGTARAVVTYFDRSPRLDPAAKSGVLVLNVSRFVRPGEIVFALLCFGIEVRGFDVNGGEVYSKDLDGFTFGDSKGGRATRVLRDLPLTISTLEVTFRGNYE
jgi:hypothetical protein